jgi:hypothetical protein
MLTNKFATKFSYIFLYHRPSDSQAQSAHIPPLLFSNIVAC